MAWRVTLYGCLVSMTIGLGACGGAPLRSSVRPDPIPTKTSVAVLPPEWMTLTPSVDVDVAVAVIRGLEQGGRILVQAPQTTASAFRSEGDGCSEDTECVRRVGAKLGAQKTVAVHLAELGSTTLVKMTLLDVDGDGLEIVQQAMVSPTTAQGISETAEEMALEASLTIAPPLPRREPEERRWYQRWWVWTLIGAGLAGTTVGVVVPLATSDDDEPRGIVITPP